MTDQDIQSKVFDIISESLSANRSEIELSSSFIDDLGADSLDIVELVMTIEKAFDIEIPDEDAEKITTVADAVDYIKEHVRR
jgi:acyl carrier protein